MSNSPLVTYTKISPNKNSPRTQKIDTITIHCTAGQCTIEALGNMFAAPSRQASSNYGIDRYGKVGMFVEEKDRSWCTSSGANDHRAITIEVSSNSYDPYEVSNNVYEVLVKLVVDICKRNGIKKLVWSTNKQDRMNHRNGCNMTVHRDYAAKACPGDYLYERMADIARRVNIQLGSEKPFTPPSLANKPQSSSYLVRVSISDLYIRKGPGTNYQTAGFISPGVYTIVEEKTGQGAKKWGKLKSGAGWISLDYTKKV